MKYDINGLEKDKIIDHYKVIKKKNNRYNVIIYFRKGVGKAINYSYEDMIELKKELDSQMLKQLKLLVENDDILEKTFSLKGAKQAKIFSRIGNTISFLIPTTFSIIFNNPINLLLIPILLKTTSIYSNELLFNIIDDEYENYEKYKMCVELENEFEAIKTNKIDLNKIDNYKIKKLKRLKKEIILQKNLENAKTSKVEENKKTKVKKM